MMTLQVDYLMSLAEKPCNTKVVSSRPLHLTMLPSVVDEVAKCMNACITLVVGGVDVHGRNLYKTRDGRNKSNPDGNDVVLLHPPVRYLGKVITNYLNDKSPNTRAVVVAPTSKTVTSVVLRHGFMVVKNLRRRTPVFAGRSVWSSPYAIFEEEPVDVNPEGPMTFDSKSPTFALDGHVCGLRARVLVDDGATGTCFVKKQFVERCNLQSHIRDTTVKVTFGNEHVTKSTAFTNLT